MVCPSCGAANEPAAEVCFSCRTVLAAVSRGTLLAARYEIQDLVGRGGMGTVYRARDRVLDEDVAIKVLRADVAQAPGMAERFLSETRLARRVSHPNVCRIHEYGEDGALRFISMELVRGKSLKDVLMAGRLSPAQAFDVAQQAARGLSAIHEVGIVHRDLKPANLTLDETGRVRVMDFGIAKAAGRAGDTTAGYLLGSPEYMSPEQARGRGADFRSDLYALGIVVYELFTGRPPFRAETPVGTLLLQIESPPPLQGDDLPGSLLPVLRRALAKDPGERQTSAHELAEALKAAAAVAFGGPKPAAGSGVPPEVPRWGRWTAVASVLGVAVMGGLWVSRPARPTLSLPVPPSAAPTATPTSSFSPPALSSPSPSPPERRPNAANDTRRPDRPPAATPVPSAHPSPSPRAVQGIATPSFATGPPDSNRPGPSETEALAQAPPTPSPAEAAPAPGYLLVVVSPWADVAIDGQPAGQTPLGRIPLPPGPHTVRLSHPAFQPYPRKITVRSGETTKITVDLAQDGVRIAH